MNEEIKKTWSNIIDDIQNCEYVFNDSMAYHCLRLSSDDIREILDWLENEFEHNEAYIFDDINPYCTKKAQEHKKDMLNTLNDLNSIYDITIKKENEERIYYIERMKRELASKIQERDRIINIVMKLQENKLKVVLREIRDEAYEIAINNKKSKAKLKKLFSIEAEIKKELNHIEYTDLYCINNEIEDLEYEIGKED